MERKFTLKEDQNHFLIENLTNSELKNKINIACRDQRLIINGHLTNHFEFFLSEFEWELLMNELTKLFTEKGLKENDEPNRTGLVIEELIDLFNRF